jgi:hypothetical protein
MTYAEGGCDLPRVSDLCVDVGGAIVFDYRLHVRECRVPAHVVVTVAYARTMRCSAGAGVLNWQHRGMANSATTESRPLLYLSHSL